MMKSALLLFCLLFTLSTHGQGIIGAWENVSVTAGGDTLRNVVIFADGYQVATTFDAATGKFISTNGGTWSLEGDMMTEKVEFHTDSAALVGLEIRFKVRVSANEIKIVDKAKVWTRIDDGAPGKLQGAWLMSGRVRDGK
ncbi:MAG: membrane or secreted protein, partial [Bacteroidota bacterium]